MLFNSIPFLCFALAFLAAYFSLSGRARLLLCLLGSYFFYAWWDWRFLFLIVLSTLVDYAVGVWLANEKRARRRKQLLAASLCVNLEILGFFKYFNFFVDSLVAATNSAGLNWNYSHLNIILPVGISFFTFQTMSYTIDIYRNKVDVERSLLRFATFVAFFPQLVAGPIVRQGQRALWVALDIWVTCALW